jgi:hypothetical protein
MINTDELRMVEQMLDRASDEWHETGLKDFLLEDTPEHREFAEEVETFYGYEEEDITIVDGKIALVDYQVAGYMAQRLRDCIEERAAGNGQDG